MSVEPAPSDGYTLGEVHPNTKRHPRVETKPSPPGYTGGGYEHARSTEYRPHTRVDRREDVYASIHRLSAVVWCYPTDAPIRDVLDDLRGKDVHHTTGIPWANFGDSPNFDEPGLTVVGHGEHSEITQAQRRAWAADSKREAERAEQQSLAEANADACDNCGETTTDPLARGEDFDGEWCIECVQDHRERQRALEELEELEI